MQEKKSSFMGGAVILISANLIVKLIGALFKIPLTHLLGETGMAYFSDAYIMYSWMFVLATAGLPVAISKMVSECSALGNTTEIKRVWRASLLFLLLLGAVGAAVLFFGATPLARLIGNDGARLGIMAIAPAMLFVSLLSAFRGFFQGHQDMLPTAISEVIEAIGKLAIGYTLAYLFLKKSIENAAAGALLGVSSGAALALLSLLCIFLVRRKRLFSKQIAGLPARSTKTLFGKLVSIAVPITIGASVFSLTSVIDMAMIKHRLVAAGLTAEVARDLWGSYSGYAVTMFNLPPTIVTAISISIVPAVAAFFVTKKLNSAKTTALSAIRITTLFALPCAAGLALLARPILQLVFSNPNATGMLSILAWAVVFVSLVQVTNSILQATGKVSVPVVHMVIGGVAKVIINYFLVAIPTVNINGAPIGTNVCYFLILALNLRAMKKVLGLHYSFTDMVLRPVIATAVMGGVVLLTYKLTAMLGNTIAVVLSIGIGGVVYIVMLFALGAVNEEDVRLLPKGNSIVRVLKKHNLLK